MFRCDGATWRLKTLSPLPRLGPGPGPGSPREYVPGQVQYSSVDILKRVNGYGSSGRISGRLLMRPTTGSRYLGTFLLIRRGNCLHAAQAGYGQSRTPYTSGRIPRFAETPTLRLSQYVPKKVWRVGLSSSPCCCRLISRIAVIGVIGVI